MVIRRRVLSDFLLHNYYIITLELTRRLLLLLILSPIDVLYKYLNLSIIDKLIR